MSQIDRIIERLDACIFDMEMTDMLGSEGIRKLYEYKNMRDVLQKAQEIFKDVKGDQ